MADFDFGAQPTVDERQLPELAAPRWIAHGDAALLIVDELGCLPFEPRAAHLFFQLVSGRCERGSMMITSNHSVAEQGEVFAHGRGGHRHP